MNPLDATASLTAAATLGPFFVVASRPEDVPRSRWCRVSDLVRDADIIRHRVEETRRLLAAPARVDATAVEARTAASITHLGLTARLVSPLLGAALLTDVLPVVGLDSWFVGPSGSGPVAVAVQAAGGVRRSTARGLATALDEHCVEPVLRPLTEAFGAAVGLSATVLWGNVASAFAGAATMVTRARPELAERAAGAVGVLLQTGPLTRTGTWVRPDPTRLDWFLVRRSCCLLYRLPGAAPCGDCILLPSDVRRRQWRVGHSAG